MASRRKKSEDGDGAPRPRAEWATIRDAFVTDPSDSTLTEYARRYGVTLDAINHHSADDGWYRARRAYRDELAAQAQKRAVRIVSDDAVRSVRSRLRDLRKLRTTLIAALQRRIEDGDKPAPAFQEATGPASGPNASPGTMVRARNTTILGDPAFVASILRQEETLLLAIISGGRIITGTAVSEDREPESLPPARID